jgi:hypothetical protein
LQKKKWSPEESISLRGFAVFAGVFEVGREKDVCKPVVFCGEFVVSWVVKRGALRGGFLLTKKCHLV